MRAPFLAPSTFAAFALVIALGGAARAQGAVDFQRQVLPILQSRCAECHATAHTGSDGKLQKPKGGVVLDSKDGITAKKGLVVPKDPAESLLVQVVTLPADDEDRMPPAKKGAPLAKEQTDLIAAWIEQGASFGTWTGKKADAPAAAAGDGDGDGASAAGGGKAGKPPKTAPKVDPIVRLQQGVKPLPPATLAAFGQGPFHVASVGDDSPLLAVGCRGNADTIDDRALQALAPIASHVVDLDLARTKVGDEGCKLIATMPKLVTLDLRQTAVGNHGVAALAACTELRSLNVFGTKTGDYGIAALATCKHLEQLYVWQTDVSAAAAVRLREQVPGLRVVVGGDLPEPMPEGAGGGQRRRR
jgi:hypothetical protein